MRRILVLYAHPNQTHSQANNLLAATAAGVDGITFVDLYAAYPRFKINVDHEQQQLDEHDVLVLQFPVYWYSTPSLLKEWQDLVLEYGYAYGPDGNALAGKLCLLAVTAGAPADAYGADGINQFELRTLLSPLEQTANLCQMRFLPPFALFASLRAREDSRIENHADAYRQLLEALRDETLDLNALSDRKLLSAADFNTQREGQA